MRYNFSFSVHIKLSGKVGQTFLRGVREVPEEYEYDPYFLKLVGLGHITEAPPAPRVTAPPAQRQALLDKILARKPAKVVAEEKVAEPVPAEEPEGEEAPKEEAKQPDDSGKKKNGKHK